MTTDRWVINTLFSTDLGDDVLGIFKCVGFDAFQGYLMIGVSANCLYEQRYSSELGICRQWQPAYDEGNYWKTKTFAKSAALDPHVLIAKIDINIT